MMETFSDALLAQWCELYVRLVIRRERQLAQAIQNCSNAEFQTYLYAKPDMATVLAGEPATDADYLTAYACLQRLDADFQQTPHPSRFHDGIQQDFAGTRYLLHADHVAPIARAVPAANRFQPDNALGIQGTIKLNHVWLAVQAASVNVGASHVFDALYQRTTVKIGLSPLAGSDDLNWRCDAEDIRSHGETPFWCAGEKHPAELAARLAAVLDAAYRQQVDILLLPELVMSQALETQLSAWLLQHNAFEPVMRLVVAGSRHVFHGENGDNDYSNRCTVFDHIGDPIWQQAKSQPFRLAAAAAQRLFGIAQAAFEPTRLAEALHIRRTRLGMLATPICLDFIQDNLWASLPVDLYLVPAMSAGLSRFHGQCRQLGGSRQAAAFICNASTNTDDSANRVCAYIPGKQQPELSPPPADAAALFTVTVAVDMN